MSRCQIKTANTASSRCKIELGVYSKTVVLPIGARFTGLDEGDNEQTLEEWLESGIHAADPAKRFYPMPEMTNVEDTTSDNVTWESGMGITHVLREGNYGFTQDYERDSCLTTRLLAFNGQQFRVLVFDIQGNVQGVRLNDGFTGELCNIWSLQPRANTPSEYSEPKIQYSFTSPSEHKLREVIPTDVNLVELTGLEDVEMVIVKKNTDLNIKFQISCSGDDVTSELSPLGGELTAWITDSGAPTAAPTYDTIAQVFTIPTTALTGKSKLGLATPDILLGLKVGNKESELVKIPE